MVESIVKEGESDFSIDVGGVVLISPDGEDIILREEFITPILITSGDKLTIVFGEEDSDG